MIMTASSSSTTGESDKILVEQKSGAKILTLNRPTQLNAISDAMMSHFLELLLAVEEDSSVKLIILKGKGRSFSCGGDVQQVARCVVEDDWKTIADILRKAYTLNYVIATYSKPQVSILDGIVMGGGAAISVHGRFRVATENSLFAMPEISLGHFPDMGASYFLSRLPGFFGEYVGLTGARLDGAEMLACGVATHFVKSEKLPLLEAALIRADSNDPSVISFVIGGFSHIPTLKTSSAYHRLNVINKCFSRRTVEEIIAALETESDRRDKWITWTIQSMKKASPTSLKLFLTSIRQGRLQGISKCLIQEFRMSGHMCDGELSRDFVEGSRAILLDKNPNPKWNPSNLESVSDDMVDQFFIKVTADFWDDLKLPARPNITTYAVAKL